MAENYLALEILGPNGLVLKVEFIDAINLRIGNGDLIGFRPGHAPLIAATQAGTIDYRIDGQTHWFEAQAGILKVQDDLVSILTT